jgi:formimidoylglutamate deiminase
MRHSIAPELLLQDATFVSGRAVVMDDGKVVAIESAADHPDAVQLQGRAMLAGLVNAHSHAFQRVFRGQTEAATGNFWTWRDAMYAAAQQLTPESFYEIARTAFLEMALSGITTVGEFHYVHRDALGRPYEDPNLMAKQAIRAARDVGLRICLLRVAYARAGFDKPLDPAQRRFVEPHAQEFIANTQALIASISDPLVRVGIAPHSIRALPLDYLHDVIHWAQPQRIPIHMHVCEQPAEIDACQAEYGTTPVALLAREGLLSDRFTGVHGIHITDAEIGALAAARSFVCACPTTERNLGDGIVPADRLLAAGVRIALGSDSQAQIDLLEDARELECHLRLQHLRRGLIAPQTLFRCATLSGAESLGVPPDAADFFTVALDGLPMEHLLPSIVFAKTSVRDVIVAAEFIVRDGRHCRIAPKRTA